ncbi:MAG: glycosyltransferase [Pseudomonadota bacterium]
MTESNRLSVMHLASGDLWAGAEVQLYQLAVELQRRADLDVSVVLLNEGLLAQRLRAAGLDVVVYDEQTLSGVQILSALRRLFRERRPTLLHTHRQKENVLGSLAARMSGVACSLRTVHGAPEFGAAGLRQKVNRWLDRNSARFLQHAVVMVTNDLATQIGADYPPQKVRVVNNGIALPAQTEPAVDNAGRYRKSDKINVCFAGRLTEVKRADIFIGIAKALEDLNDSRFHCHVFGDGPLEQALREQIDREGTQSAVSLWGFCDDMPAALREMDALVMTSNHEGLPMIMLEAMALGVPVVAHAVGGMPEVLGNGDCGVLVSDHSGAGFAAALRSAHDSGALQRNAAAAQVRFDRHYTIAACADRYEALYRELVSTRARS